MIERKLYIDKIRPFMNKPLIKVLTGIRRSGKSALLTMLKDMIISDGVQESNVVYINFESLQYADITNAIELYQYVKEKIGSSTTSYIFLDEIQQVHQWEKAVNSFVVDFGTDVYITGSNSRLLSSELATLIAGRYVEFHINPLSFSESMSFISMQSVDSGSSNSDKFKKYLRFGGFPVVHNNSFSEPDAMKIINDIYASALLRDVVERRNIRNTQLLEKVVKFVLDNIGCLFSAKKIVDYFKSQQRKADIETIFNYLEALEQAFIIQKAPRYDLKGKEILQTNEKYFLGDHALKNAVLGYKDRDISGILENIVFLELKRREYKIYVGKLNEKEIDFIAERGNEKIYIQVAYKLASEDTVQREFGPLLAIADNYPKFVVTMDDFWKDNIEGIKHCHIADFLLSDSY